MTPELWIALAAILSTLLVGTAGVIGGYKAATKGARATRDAGEEQVGASLLSSLATSAAVMVQSSDPAVRAAGYGLLNSTVRALGDHPETPLLIQGMTRHPDLSDALEAARRMEGEKGRPPTVGPDDETGGYL